MPALRDLAGFSGAVYRIDSDAMFAPFQRLSAGFSRTSGSFYAELYSGGGGVLAFRGTEAELGDIGTDATLYFGNWQIGNAARIAREVVQNYPRVVFTGHSLGGFLAQVACAATGRPCVSFNGPAFRTGAVNTVLAGARIGNAVPVLGTVVGALGGLGVVGAQRGRDWYHDLNVDHVEAMAWHVYHPRDPVSSIGRLAGPVKISVPDSSLNINPLYTHAISTLFTLLGSNAAIGQRQVS